MAALRASANSLGASDPVACTRYSLSPIKAALHTRQAPPY